MTNNIPKAWADVTLACEHFQAERGGEESSSEALATLLALRCKLEDSAAWSHQLFDGALEILEALQVADTPTPKRLDELVAAIRIHQCRLHMERYACPERGCPAKEFGRDCDNVEATSLRWINPPTIEELAKVEADIEAGAEGAWSLTLLTLDQAADFEPSTRDRNLEAFENGRGTSATI